MHYSAADARTPVQALALVVTRVDSDASATSRVLTELGFGVHRVRSYRDAVTELMKYSFTLIITDLNLGDGGWKDIIGHTAALCEAPRVLLLAPGVDSVLCAEAVNLGAHDVLARPLDEQEIRHLAELAAGGLLRGGTLDMVRFSTAGRH